jgi:hypothetical protein
MNSAAIANDPQSRREETDAEVSARAEQENAGDSQGLHQIEEGRVTPAAPTSTSTGVAQGSRATQANARPTQGLGQIVDALISIGPAMGAPVGVLQNFHQITVGPRTGPAASTSTDSRAAQESAQESRVAQTIARSSEGSRQISEGRRTGPAAAAAAAAASTEARATQEPRAAQTTARGSQVFRQISEGRRTGPAAAAATASTEARATQESRATQTTARGSQGLRQITEGRRTGLAVPTNTSNGATLETRVAQAAARIAQELEGYEHRRGQGETNDDWNARIGQAHGRIIDEVLRLGQPNPGDHPNPALLLHVEQTFSNVASALVIRRVQEQSQDEAQRRANLARIDAAVVEEVSQVANWNQQPRPESTPIEMFFQLLPDEAAARDLRASILPPTAPPTPRSDSSSTPPRLQAAGAAAAAARPAPGRQAQARASPPPRRVGQSTVRVPRRGAPPQNQQQCPLGCTCSRCLWRRHPPPPPPAPGCFNQGHMLPPMQQCNNPSCVCTVGCHNVRCRQCNPNRWPGI